MKSFLARLLSADVPPDTTLGENPTLSYSGLLPVWLAIVLFFVLGLVIVGLYLRERGKLTIWHRLLLSTLRLVLVGLVLFLLCRPILLVEFHGKRPRSVVLMVDNSQSLKQQDHRKLIDIDRMRVAIANGLVKDPAPADMTDSTKIPDGTPVDPSRADVVKAVLLNKNLDLVEKIEKDKKFGALRTYMFGNHLRAPLDKTGAGTKKSTVERILDKDNFTQADDSTALADGIFEVLQRKVDDLPTAIVAMTDGQENRGKYTLAEAAEECKRVGVPLHIYGVGSTEGGSLKFREVGTPETMFVEDKILIPLRWRAQGLKKGKVEISVTLNGKSVWPDKKKIDLDVQNGDDLRYVVDFTVPKTGAKEETRDLVTTISHQGVELYKDVSTKSVRIVDRKIKVLYIEHSPRFEYKFLMGALTRDRRVDPTFVLINADPKVANSGAPYLPKFPETRAKFFDAKYNVIILGDVAATYLGTEHMEWIREFVQNRGGLIILSGRQHMPNTYVNTPLYEVFPVDFKTEKAKLPTEERTTEYPPTLTDVGIRTDMLSLTDNKTEEGAKDKADENVKEWAARPGFYWNYPVTKLRPGAVSLVVNPRAKMGDQPMPIVAMQYFGKGQVLYLGTDETWRWRLNAENKYFTRFWGQVIYQMGLPTLMGDSAKRAHVVLERSEAFLNTPTNVFVRLLDRDFKARKDEKVEATIEYLDAKGDQDRFRKITLERDTSPGSSGEYKALLPNDRSGRFELKVNNPDPTTFQYRVEVPPGHEMEEVGLNEKGLTELAKLSGGRFYREEDLHTLVSSITPQKADFTRKQEVLLWNPLMLVLFILLITVEWIVRKFANLS